MHLAVPNNLMRANRRQAACAFKIWGVFLWLATGACVACGDEPATNATTPAVVSSGAGGYASPAAAGTVSAGTRAGAAAAGGASGRPAEPPTASAQSGAGAGTGSSGSGATTMGAAPTEAGRASARGGAGAAAEAGTAAPPQAGSAGGQATDYAPCPQDAVCKILPLGDSITYGIGYAGGYRVELFRKAQADGKAITFTGSLSNGPNTVDGMPFPKNNEGHSGWKIDQLVPLIPRPALQDPPHIVLLMIGTNDIAQRADLANAPKRLGALLDKLAMEAPTAAIVVATLVPLNGADSAVQSYNAALPGIVQARAAAGMHVTLIDQFKGFPASELGDGVHPNRQGYERMAGTWYEAIRAWLH